MRRSDFSGFVGMNAYRGVDPIVRFGVRNGGVELLRAWSYADGKDRVHAGGAGAVQHSGAVFIELREIDVSVRIDKIHSQRFGVGYILDFGQKKPGNQD